MLSTRSLVTARRLSAAGAAAAAALALSACGVQAHVHVFVHDASSSTAGAPVSSTGSGPAAALVKASRSAIAGASVVEVQDHDRYLSGPPSHRTEIFSPQEYVNENTIASSHNDQRIFKSGDAFVRASPAFWFTTARATGAAIPALANRWVAVPAARIGLGPAVIAMLRDHTTLAGCLVETIPGGALSIAGHTTWHGVPATVVADRAPGSRETERLVIQTSAPHRPLSLRDTGPLAARPACGESAALGKTISHFSTRFVYGAHAPSRPAAAVSVGRYDAINPVHRTTLPVLPSAARALTGTWHVTGRVAAEISWHGSGLGGTEHQTWTIRSRCTGGSCRLTLSTPGHRTPVALHNTGIDGYVATTSIRGLRCTAGRQAVSPTLYTSVLPAGPHRISAYSTFEVSRCGGAAGVELALRGTD